MPAPYYVYWGPIHAPGQDWEGPFDDLEKAQDFVYAKADELCDIKDEKNVSEGSDESDDDDDNSDSESVDSIGANSTGVYFDPTNGKDDGNIYAISSIPPQKKIIVEDDDDYEPEKKNDLIIRKILAWEYNGPDLANYWFPQIDLFPATEDEDIDDEDLSDFTDSSDNSEEEESIESIEFLSADESVKSDKDSDGSDNNNFDEDDESTDWPEIMFAENEDQTLTHLENDEDPDYQSGLGWTPMMEARNVAQVKILKNYGADHKKVSREGWNALLLARTTAITKYLLKLGMDPNVEVEGRTPLTMARFPGQTLALLEAEAKIDREDSLSPLFYNKNLTQIYHLLREGADPEAVDENGKTVVESEEVSEDVKKMVQMAIDKKPIEKIYKEFKNVLEE